MPSTHLPETPAPTRPRDNLTRISGVGPVVAARLADAGIRTYGDLEHSTPEELAAALVGLPACSADRIRAADWIGQARRLGGSATASTTVPDDEPASEAPPVLRVVRLGRARIRPVHDCSLSDHPTAVGLELRGGLAKAPTPVLDYSAAIVARRLDADGEVPIANVSGVVDVDRGVSHSAAGPPLEAGLYRLVATIHAGTSGREQDAPSLWSQEVSGDLVQVITPSAAGTRRSRPAKPHPASRRLLEDGLISEAEFAELQGAAAAS
jgi:hypothetical protein